MDHNSFRGYSVRFEMLFVRVKIIACASKKQGFNPEKLERVGDIGSGTAELFGELINEKT